MPNDDRTADLVVIFSGAIDRTTAEAVAEVTELARLQSRRLVIDLRDATTIDSEGLRGLLRGHRALEAAGSSLVLRRPSGPVRAVLAMTDTSDILDIRD